MAVKLGLLGHTALGEGPVGCPSRISLYRQQQNALRNPLDRVSLPPTSTADRAETAQLFLTRPVHQQSRVCITQQSSVSGSMFLM